MLVCFFIYKIIYIIKIDIRIIDIENLKIVDFIDI